MIHACLGRAVCHPQARRGVLNDGTRIFDCDDAETTGLAPCGGEIAAPQLKGL
jgi:hypothetical protein